MYCKVCSSYKLTIKDILWFPMQCFFCCYECWKYKFTPNEEEKCCKCSKGLEYCIWHTDADKIYTNTTILFLCKECSKICPNCKISSELEQIVCTSCHRTKCLNCSTFFELYLPGTQYRICNECGPRTTAANIITLHHANEISRNNDELNKRLSGA